MIVERKQQKRRAPARPDETLQTAVLAYLAQALPPTAFFAVFPPGGGGQFHGLKMRDLGARHGFPNLIVLHEGRAYCIELSPGTGTPRSAGRDCRAALQDARVPVATARSLKDVQRFLAEECALGMRNWRRAS